MSVISLLVLQPSKMPTLSEIAAEAVRGGDDIAFPESVDLKTHTGFLPVKVMGRDTGFEHYFEPIPDGSLPPEATVYGSHHIVSQTASSFEEGRAALVYLKVVARMTGGAYVYPDDAIIIGPHSGQDYLDEQIAGFGKHIK